MITTEQRNDLRSAMAMVFTLAELVRELKEVPAGHLYSRLMGQMDIHTFEKCVSILVNSKLVTRKNHLLTWVGPTLN